MQVGSAEEIYERPTSEFVAGFIGRTNLFTGRLAEASVDRGYGVVESSIGPVRCWFHKASPKGAAVKFVTRPENVECARVSVDHENTFEGKVVSRVYLGDIAEYAIRVGDMDVLVRAHPSVALMPGDTTPIYFPADRTIAICE